MYLSQSFIYKTAAAAMDNIKPLAAEVGNGLFNKPDKKKKEEEKWSVYKAQYSKRDGLYICSPVYLILLCNRKSLKLNMDYIYCPIFR